MIDIHNLHDRAKRFVVGVVVKRLFEQKETTGSARPLVFLVLDELNKYAPREGWTPIKEVLLDIAERGRSLGVILIGAQQTASEVERRIVAELRDPRRRPARPGRGAARRVRVPDRRPRASARRSSSRGRCSSSSRTSRSPLEVRFPFPAWATRASEAADADRRPRSVRTGSSDEAAPHRRLARRQDARPALADRRGARRRSTRSSRSRAEEKVDAVLVCGRRLRAPRAVAGGRGGRLRGAARASRRRADPGRPDPRQPRPRRSAGARSSRCSSALRSTSCPRSRRPDRRRHRRAARPRRLDARRRSRRCRGWQSGGSSRR